MQIRFYIALSLAVMIGSCTNKGNAPGGSSVNMLYVTGPVGGSSSASKLLSDLVTSKANTGVSLNVETCPGCGTNLELAHSLGAIFAIQGKLADNNSCMIAAVIANDAVPGLTSGQPTYINVGENKMRVKLTMSGTDVADFAIETCSGGEQVQHISGTNTAGAATFKFRSGTGSSTFAAMDASGTISGGNWTSKTLTVGFANSGQYIQFVMEQADSYMDFTGVSDSGTLGTLDGADLQLVSRVQLLGDSVTTYALGDGSVRMALGGGVAANSNWDGDTKTEGSGPTTYDSVVASATLPAIPTTRVTAFTSDEEWDCNGAGATDLMAVAQSNAQLLEDATKCQEIFE